MTDEPPIADAEAATSKGPVPRRYKIWEIPGTVQCSIVGTCLDRRDIQALMRKGKVRTQPGATHRVSAPPGGVRGRARSLQA